MQESTLNFSKSGPIHLPKDGRPVVVEVTNFIKIFGMNETVKGASITIEESEI
jgi:ABC-2 type transport system ATP-binding protein